MRLRQGIKNDIFTLDVDPPEYPAPSYLVLWAIYLANVNARFTEPPPVIQPLGLLQRASWHPERNLYRHVIPTSTARRNPEGRRRRGRAFLSSPWWLLTRRVKSGNHRRESICSFAL